MTEEVVDKEEGWREWLMQYQLWGEQLSEQRNYVRYKQFKGLDLGVIPPEQRGRYYHDLLPYERGLVYGDAIGRVDKYEFDF